VRSEEFRGRWGAHDVIEWRTGTQRSVIPSSASSPSTTTALGLPADPGQVVVAYTAEPGNPSHDAPSHDALTLLASWEAGSASTPPLATEAEPTPP
jgi:hypothetical protein